MSIIFFLCFLFSFSLKAYVEEEVQFPISKSNHLTGYATYPKRMGKFPILVMQMGHGQGTTDSKTRIYNPFSILAREIADQGFIVLRFDKRGTGYNSSQGSYADAMLVDFVSDLRAAVEYMRRNPHARKDEVYLFGHSLGGLVASKLSQSMPEVKGVILSCSPGRRYADFNEEQMKHLFEWGDGLKGKRLDEELAKVKRSHELIGRPELFCREFSSDCEKKNGVYYLYGQNLDFWKEIARLDPIEEYRKTGARIFSIQGSSDWVISSENDGRLIAQSLRSNSKFSSTVLSRLDHFLLETNSKEESIKKFRQGLKDKDLTIHPKFPIEIFNALRTWVKN